MFGRPLNRSDYTRYCVILGVPESASQDELKRAYKIAAMKSHPDKGGDAEKFNEVTQAYEILSARAQEGGLSYAQYLHCLHAEVGGGNWFHDRSSRGQRKKPSDNVVVYLKVSLEDLYNGTSKKLTVSRNLLCPNCKGEGSNCPPGLPCVSCKGCGVIDRLANGSIVSDQCHDCRGSGIYPPEKDKCTECKGHKFRQAKKVLMVHIERGMQDGQKILFPGEGHEARDTVTGDAVVVLQLLEHPKFSRNFDDLYAAHTLGLTEVLCGSQFSITHLDGRHLLIKLNRGEIIQPGQYKAIINEGMPHYARPSMKGRLYIHFNIEFPDSKVLSLEEYHALGSISHQLDSILPPKTRTHPLELDESEETTLVDVNMEEMKWKPQHHHSTTVNKKRTLLFSG